MPLTIEAVRRMINASQEKARELGVAVSTAIVDDEGRLFAFERRAPAGSLSRCRRPRHIPGHCSGVTGRNSHRWRLPRLQGSLPCTIVLSCAPAASRPCGRGTGSLPGSVAAARPTSRTGSVRTPRVTLTPDSQYLSAASANRRGSTSTARGELFSRDGAKLYLDQVLARKEILKA